MVVMGLPVGRSVTVGRTVATTDVTATHAQAKVHPAPAGLETVFAAVARGSDVVDSVEVGTGIRHAMLFRRSPNRSQPTTRQEPSQAERQQPQASVVGERAEEEAC
jgi:hypothetical protein